MLSKWNEESRISRSMEISRRSHGHYSQPDTVHTWRKEDAIPEYTVTNVGPAALLGVRRKEGGELFPVEFTQEMPQERKPCKNVNSFWAK